MIKKIVVILLFFSFKVQHSLAQSDKLTEQLGSIKLEFSLDKSGTPEYAVYFKDQTIIKPSALGFNLKDNDAFNNHFKILRSERKTFDETWKPVWGEVNQIRNHYNQLTIYLQEENSPNRLLNIVFRVFEDGVGFRYEFPVQPHLKYFVIADELTQFNLTGDHKTFWIPGDYDSNEYPYTTSKLSEIDAWKLPLISTNKKEMNEPDQYAVQTPLMMKTTEGFYINIHEAALVHYTSMQLHVDRKTYGLSCKVSRPMAPGL
jgi:hypothetical protein